MPAWEGLGCTIAHYLALLLPGNTMINRPIGMCAGVWPAAPLQGGRRAVMNQVLDGAHIPSSRT